MNLTVLATVYIRYKEVDTIEGLPPQQIGCLNKTSAVLAVIGTLGLSVVANFQVGFNYRLIPGHLNEIHHEKYNRCQSVMDKSLVLIPIDLCIKIKTAAFISRSFSKDLNKL